MFQSCGSSSIDVRRRARPTRVIRRSPWSTAIAGADGFRAHDHRAQLQHLEVDAVLADTGLPVEDGATILELDRERGEADERTREREPDTGDGDVRSSIHRVPLAFSQVCGVPERR